MRPVITPETDIFELDFELVAESATDEPHDAVTRFATQDACGTCTPTVGAVAAPGRCP